MGVTIEKIFKAGACIADHGKDFLGFYQSSAIENANSMVGDCYK